MSSTPSARARSAGPATEEFKMLSPGAHMNRVRLMANAPLEVNTSTEFNRYYFMEEWQFPQSKSQMLSDYMHSCDFLKKRHSPKRKKKSVMAMPYDQRAGNGVAKGVFGHPFAHKGQSLYIDSYISDSHHRRALHKAKKECGINGLSTTDVTAMAEGMDLMKNVVRK